MSEVYSDYWQCEECGAVLYSPTTGRADGVQCWKCNGAPVVLIETVLGVRGEWEPTF
jgi:hypothetical protein